jgi:hypothetical protein
MARVYSYYVKEQRPSKEFTGECVEDLFEQVNEFFSLNHILWTLSLKNRNLYPRYQG